MTENPAAAPLEMVPNEGRILRDVTPLCRDKRDGAP